VVKVVVGETFPQTVAMVSVIGFVQGEEKAGAAAV
jgi:hypothetical protein